MFKENHRTTRPFSEGMGGDVALFIDWENIKSSLSDRGLTPNVSSLRETAEGFGRLVIARAYADWQDAWLRGDPPNLYTAGIEPVYVPTRIFGARGTILPERRKNSVDVKLAADCIECCHTYPHINTYILASGDGDFVHVVNILRPYGKRVVVIGASWSFSAYLRDSVDQVLYYDRDVEPINTPTVLPQTADGNGELDRIFALVVEIIREGRLKDRALLTWIKDELAQRLGGFDPMRYGFPKFKSLMLEAERRGYIKVVTYGLVDWAYLPNAVFPISEQDRPSDARETEAILSANGNAEEAQRLAELIRFAHHLELGNDHVSFNFLLDEILRAGLWRMPRNQLADRINEIIDAGVFLRVAHPWQDRNTGEPITIRTIKLNRQHPLVIAALEQPRSIAVSERVSAPPRDPALQQALEDLAANPRDPEAYLQVARRYLQLKRYDEALEYQKQAVALAPNEPIYRTYVARTLAQAGRIEAAEEYCQETIARFPDDHRPRATLGMILYQQGRYAEAMPYLLAALERCPQDSPDYLVHLTALARTYRDLGDEAAMRRVVEDGLRIDPKDEGLLELKRWLEMTPNQREALALAKRAASMIGKEGEEEELIHYASSAIVLDPEISYLPYYALGEGYKALQRWELAADALEKAAQRCDNPGTLRIIYSNLRNVYARLNRLDKVEEAQAQVERLTAEIHRQRRAATPHVGASGLLDR
ncbi:MAG: NYN domain-containing protein [Anaerolineae bacterium]|nr:NYN domain-containing protein [Anaerolineae bacterium]MDW8098286.1 NYN domain-containing protein [Anaerolineae bacterium]